MQETLIELDTAKLAKEKGFDWNHEYMVFSPVESEKYPEGDIILKPTQSLLQKWLRDIHKIDVEPCFRVTYSKDRFYNTHIVSGEDGYIWVLDETNTVAIFETYEQALEAGLKEALTIIDSK